MKLQELRKAAKECKDELGFTEINPKGKQADLEAQLIEVAMSIGAEGEDAIEESELDGISKTTKTLLLKLRDENSEGKEEAPEEKPTKKEKKIKKTKKEKVPEPTEKEEEEEEKKMSAMKFIQICICKNFKVTNETIIEKLEKAGYDTTSERYVDMRRKEALAVITILQELEKVN